MIFFWDSGFMAVAGSYPFYWNGNGAGVSPFPPTTGTLFPHHLHFKLGLGL